MGGPLAASGRVVGDGEARRVTLSRSPSAPERPPRPPRALPLRRCSPLFGRVARRTWPWRGRLRSASGSPQRRAARRRNGLRAADRQDAIHGGDAQRRQHMGVTLALRRRYRDDHFADPRHPRRNRRHQHRGRIRRSAAGHVDAYAVEGVTRRPSILPRASTYSNAALGGRFQSTTVCGGSPSKHGGRSPLFTRLVRCRSVTALFGPPALPCRRRPPSRHWIFGFMVTCLNIACVRARRQPACRRASFPLGRGRRKFSP